MCSHSCALLVQRYLFSFLSFDAFSFVLTRTITLFRISFFFCAITITITYDNNQLLLQLFVVRCVLTFSFFSFSPFLLSFSYSMKLKERAYCNKNDFVIMNHWRKKKNTNVACVTCLLTYNVAIGNEHISNMYSKYSTDSCIEEQNDQRTDQLCTKVKRLKSIVIEINDETKRSTAELSGYSDLMSSLTNRVGQAQRRVKLLSRTGSWKLYYFLIMFSLFVFLLIYIVVK